MRLEVIVCDAYNNLKAGNIKYFNMNFKKSTSKRQTIELAKTDIKLLDKCVRISPSKFQKHETNIKIHKTMHKKIKNIKIMNNCDLVKECNKYFILILLPEKIKEQELDPGIRTFVSI